MLSGISPTCARAASLASLHRARPLLIFSLNLSFCYLHASYSIANSRAALVCSPVLVFVYRKARSSSSVRFYFLFAKCLYMHVVCSRSLHFYDVPTAFPAATWLRGPCRSTTFQAYVCSCPSSIDVGCYDTPISRSRCFHQPSSGSPLIRGLWSCFRRRWGIFTRSKATDRPGAEEYKVFFAFPLGWSDIYSTSSKDDTKDFVCLRPSNNLSRRSQVTAE